MIQSSKPTVLIVEDEILIRLEAVDGFKNAGFIVLQADCAAEALQITAENSAIQLLFTDVSMPGEMNGIALARHLLRLAPGLHVMVTSALPVTELVERLPALFVEKPYRTADVCSAARRLLAA